MTDGLGGQAGEREMLTGFLDWYRAVVPHEVEGLSRTDAYGFVSLRWVVVHLIEETARHTGHLDVMRELIDGRTGE